jgi:G patch domain-containing protein 1
LILTFRRVIQSQEAQAAAMKMFGQLTRTTKPFYPSRLVCKRFNVRNPHPDKQADDAAGRRTQAGAKQPLSKESVRTMMNNNTLDEFTSTPDFANDPLMQAIIPKPSDRAQQEQLTTQTIAQTTSEKAIADTVEEKQELPLDYERPSIDIFKAIFEDSDEDDEEEDEGEPEPEPMSTLAHQTTMVDNEMADDSNVIGPPLPPAPEEESKPVFRPMFKKRIQDRQIKDDNASSRSVHVGPMSFISSEEHVVEPFSKTSSDNSRREQKRSRRDDSDQESSEERRRSSTRTHHHKKESKKKKRKSDRSQSRERRHKKSKKRRRERSHSEIDPDEIAERLVYDDSLWVEKPAVAAPVKTRQAESSSKARPKAYDMW